MISSSEILPRNASEANFGKPTGDKPIKIFPVLCSLYSDQVALLRNRIRWLFNENFSTIDNQVDISNSPLKHLGSRFCKPSSSPGIWSKELKQLWSRSVQVINISETVVWGISNLKCKSSSNKSRRNLVSVKNSSFMSESDLGRPLLLTDADLGSLSFLLL